MRLVFIYDSQGVVTAPDYGPGFNDSHVDAVGGYTVR